MSTYSEFDGLNLALEFASFVGGDGSGYDGAGYTACATKSSLRGDKDIRDVLVLTQQGEMKNDLNRFDVSSHDDKFADTTVEGFGRLVGALLQLLVVTRLLDQVEDLVGKGGVGQGESLGIRSRHVGTFG